MLFHFTPGKLLENLEGAHGSWMGGFRQSGFDTHFSKCVALNIA